MADKKKADDFNELLDQLCRNRKINLNYTLNVNQGEGRDPKYVVTVTAGEHLATGKAANEVDAKLEASANALIKILWQEENSTKHILPEPSSKLVQTNLASVMTHGTHNMCLDDDDLKRDKTELLDMCIKNLVKQGCSLKEVKTLINEIIDYSPCDGYYIMDKYVNVCFCEFRENALEYLKSNILEISADLQYFITLMNNIQKISDIRKPFDKLPFYLKLIENGPSLVALGEKNLVTAFKKDCWSCLEELVSSLRVNFEFVTELQNCLRNSFLHNTPEADSLASSSGNKETVLSGLLKTLEQTNEPRLYSLKNIAQNVDSHDNKLLAELVKAVIDDYWKHFSVYVKNNKGEIDLEYIGGYIDLRDVINHINSAHPTKILKEVKIIAMQALRANSSFEMSGTNIVIVASEILINEECVWDVSGSDAPSHKGSKADNGHYPGDDGCAGLNGNHGESGGNMLILTDKIGNVERLTIKSHGGKGSNGQHGGDGKPGKDGEDGKGLSEEEFKVRFPDCAVLLGKQAAAGFQKCLDNIETISFEHPQLSVGHEKWSLNNTPNSYYCEMKTRDNHIGIFSQYTGHPALAPASFIGFPYRKVFCILYGTDGSQG